MNKFIALGNVTRKPELRKVKTANGEVSVIDVDLAVNNRTAAGNTTLFIRATAWRGLADTIAKYVDKGQKLYLDGPVDVETYTKKDGTPGATLHMTIDNFEFASSNGGASDGGNAATASRPTNYDAKPKKAEAVSEETDELPF